MPTAQTTTTAATAAAVPAPPLAGWIEVFRAGQHTDSKGRTRTFSDADLDQMVANHALGAAPAVLGHPKHDDPAYAWISGLRRDGSGLYAAFEDIHPAFEAGVASGAYRNRSLAVYRDPANGWRVRHVGWLGAVPPAIDGLSRQARTFSAAAAPPDGVELLEFAAAGRAIPDCVDALVRLMRGLRDHLIEQSGVETADRVLPQFQLDWAGQMAADARRDFDERDGGLRAAAFQRQQPNDDHTMTTTTITQEQHDQALAQARREADAAAESRFSAQGAELVELRAERQRERIGTAINAWKAAGKVLPADEPGLAEFMAALENSDDASFEFAAAGGAKTKKTAGQWFADFMAARRPQLALGRKKDDDDGPQPVDASDYQAICRAAEQFISDEAKAGRSVSVAQAVVHVTTTRGTAA